jgi:hypothetical protein
MNGSPWIVRQNGVELARGGDWSRGGEVRVWPPEPCAAPKPHVDANGERDSWRICGAPVERLASGEPTGRCRACREREAMRRQERAGEALLVVNRGQGLRTSTRRGDE